MFMESGSSIKVGVRTRPLGLSELRDGCQSCVGFPGGDELIIGGTKQFSFDYVFSDRSTQQEIYDLAVKSTINNLFNGYNVTVLAYGQTGSGKTFTMGTDCTDVFIKSSSGIIPRAIYDIYKYLEEIRQNADVFVKVSFIEVYNEEIFDLLSNNKEVRTIREENQDVKIPGLIAENVDTIDDIFKCLLKGSNNRSIGSTAMNKMSSRSHTIFTIYFSVVPRENSANMESLTSKLLLVDLAGSERVSKTGATGDRFKEGVNINRGLLALGNVLSSLVERDKFKDRNKHIPYRESKLTRLLQDSLGGNTKTLMLACISPADWNFEETSTTLNYAARARMIQNKPVINTINSAESEVYQLRAQVTALKAQLIGEENLSTHSIVPSCSMSLSQSNQICELNSKLLFMQRDRLQLLQEFEEETVKKEELLKRLWEKIVHENSDKDEIYRELEEMVNEIRCGNEQDDIEIEDEKTANIGEARYGDLSRLREELATKETALQHSEDDLKTLQHYEERNRELELRIKSLENEKVMKRQFQHQSEVEVQLKEARRQLADLQNFKRDKDRKTEEVVQLKEKIQELKSSIVKVTKDMYKEKVMMKKLAADKDKQYKSLVHKDILLKTQMERQVMQHAKETAVLRRKLESGAANEKRLKELLENKKDYKMNRITRDVMDKNISSQVKLWIRQSLDQAAEIYEARQRVAKLFDKRRKLSEQVLQLSAEDSLVDNLRTDLEQEIARINECLSLQQANHNTNAGTETDMANWNQLRNIGECRIAIRYMFRQLVEERVGNVMKDGDLQELRGQNVALEEINQTLNNEVAVCSRALFEHQQMTQKRAATKRKNSKTDSIALDENLSGPQSKKKRCTDTDGLISSRSSIISDTTSSRRSMRLSQSCRCKNGCKATRCGCIKADTMCSQRCQCKGTCLIDALTEIKENLIDTTLVCDLSIDNDNDTTICNKTFTIID